MLDVLFVVSTDVIELRREVNGTMLLGTKLLQAGISVEVLRFGESKAYLEKQYDLFIADFTNRILEREAKCVSFYTLWPYYHIILRLAKEIKKRNTDVIVVLGGPQASATAEATLSAMPQVDYICCDEGENTVVPFFKTVLADDTAGLTKVPSLWYRKDGQICFNDLPYPLCDLNTLPYWDDRLYNNVIGKENYESKEYYMPIDAGRGCPYSCTFCSTKNFWHRTYRLKSSERILEEIHYYYNKFGIRSFNFSHDAFTANQKLVSEVCDKILEKKLDIRWRCSTRIDCISKDLILKMKESGLHTISLGIETGSARMQKLINKRLNLSVVREKVQYLMDNGIEVELYFMYGFPEETEEDLNETLELAFDLLDMGVRHETMAICRFGARTTITEMNYDQLVLDTDAKMLFRGAFGAKKEMDMIRDNKGLFIHYYHLPTEVRNNYHYVYFLNLFYQKYPLTMSFLRQTYNKDNLKFYRDFIESNSCIFEQSISSIMQLYFSAPEEMLRNMWRHMDHDDALFFENVLKCEMK